MVQFDTFSVLMSVLGGALIGTAATLNLHFYGKTTGISGITYTVALRDKTNGFYWKYSFLAGLITLPFIAFQIFGEELEFAEGVVLKMFQPNLSTQKNLSWLGWTIGGFLVGFGTKMSNGCTSGHGVCGVPRFSLRSITAVITFVLSAILLATLRQEFPFLSQEEKPGKDIGFAEEYQDLYFWIQVTVFALIQAFYVYVVYFNVGDRRHNGISYGLGALFGLGLLISGMTNIKIVRDFLIVSTNDWNPQLIFVLLSAVVLNIFTFRAILARGAPKYENHFDVSDPTAKPDFQLVLGALIFGSGWGLTGLCPGPGIVNLFVLQYAIFWLFTFVLGQITYEVFRRAVEERTATNKTIQNQEALLA